MEIDLPDEEADPLHAIYERIVVAGLARAQTRLTGSGPLAQEAGARYRRVRVPWTAGVPTGVRGQR